MLYYETVAAETLGLLKSIQSIPEFESLRLVGGTALALHIGHRKSVDLDLFGKLDIDDYELLKILKTLGETINIKSSKNIKIYTINGIKVDIVNYPYNWIKPSLIENNISIAATEDIAPMKLEAVTGRGTKKDFIDIYFLLKSFSLDKMLKLYTHVSHEQKYNNS